MKTCKRGHDAPREDSHCAECRRDRQRTIAFRVVKNKYRRNLASARDQATLKELANRWR